MVEPGGLPSMGSHRAGHEWSDLAAAAAANRAEEYRHYILQAGKLISKELKAITYINVRTSSFTSNLAVWFECYVLVLNGLYS